MHRGHQVEIMTGPCPQCGADDWRRTRPGLWRGTTAWLVQGGRWRPLRAVCRSCGTAAPGGVAWLLRSGPRRRVTLPLRVVRALWQALDHQRTAQPDPAVYLGSAVVGALVGVVLAVATRSGRRTAGGAAGAASGLLVAWSVFTSTAARAPGTWDAVRDGLLAEVDPAGALHRSQQRQVRLARSATFPAYGLADWTGPRLLGGTSSEWHPHERAVRVTSLGLEHAAALADGPRVLVETGPADDAHAPDLEQRLADELSWRPGAGPPTGEALAHLVAARRGGATPRSEPPWQDGWLDVAGRAVPARRLVEGEDWVAYGLVDDLCVVVTAHRVAPEDLPPLGVVDVSQYRSPEPSA